MDDLHKSTGSGKELSLVELATILVRRFWAFLLVFLLVGSIGVGYAFVAKDYYSYTTVVALAELDRESYLQSPAAAIAMLRDREFPVAAEEYAKSHNGAYPPPIDILNPKNTGLLLIKTETPAQNSDAVAWLHQELAEGLERYQQRRLSEERIGIEESLASVNAMIESIRADGNSGMALSGAIESSARLERQKQALKPLEVVDVARESRRPTKPARLVIAVVSLVVATLLGLFAAFFVEFVSLVRIRLRDSGT